MADRSRARELRCVPTDLDWSQGDGPEAHGTGEALALAVIGRPAVRDELSGDGLEVLRSRVSAPSR